MKQRTQFIEWNSCPPHQLNFRSFIKILLCNCCRLIFHQVIQQGIHRNSYHHLNYIHCKILNNSTTDVSVTTESHSIIPSFILKTLMYFRNHVKNIRFPYLKYSSLRNWVPTISSIAFEHRLSRYTTSFPFLRHHYHYFLLLAIYFNLHHFL